MSLIVLLCLTNPAQADTFVPNGTGTDTEAIKQAIYTEAALNPTATNPGLVKLAAGSCDSNPYTTDGQITLNGVVQHVHVVSADDTAKACIRRATVPTGPAQAFRWFAVTDKDVTNFALKRIVMDGRGPGFKWDTDYIVDQAIGINPQDATPGDVSTYVKGITLYEVDMNRMYGLCWFSQHTTDVSVRQVNCNDPTKDGFTFGYGTWGGEVWNTNATLVGDDAFAWNSCWINNISQCARSGNFVGGNLHGSVDPDGPYGAAFFSRGAKDIQLSNSEFGRSAVGNGNGNRKGSVMIEESTDPDPALFHSQGIQITGSQFRAGSIHHAVYLDDPQLSNIGLNNDVFDYGGNYCGIFDTARTNIGAVTWGNATWNPNGPNNRC